MGEPWYEGKPVFGWRDAELHWQSGRALHPYSSHEEEDWDAEHDYIPEEDE